MAISTLKQVTSKNFCVPCIVNCVYMHVKSFSFITAFISQMIKLFSFITAFISQIIKLFSFITALCTTRNEQSSLRLTHVKKALSFEKIWYVTRKEKLFQTRGRCPWLVCVSGALGALDSDSCRTPHTR